MGLGNPGNEYEGTRHNTGRSALLAFASKHKFSACNVRKELEGSICDGTLDGHKVRLLLPETYMNSSGRALSRALKDASDETQVIAVYDDLDLPLGSLKLSFDSGSGGHHGVDSLIIALKTKAFTRVRIGIAPIIGNKATKPQGHDAVHAFLMQRFTAEERKIFEHTLPRIFQALQLIVGSGRARAMNDIN